MIIGNGGHAKVLRDFTDADTLGFVGKNCDDLFKRLIQIRDDMPIVVHPLAIESENCIVEEGVQILAGAIVNAGAVLQRGCIINSGAIVEHDAVIGAGSHIAPGAIVLGGAKVGECCYIGAGAVVIQGTVVPAGTFIKALEIWKQTSPM